MPVEGRLDSEFVGDAVFVLVDPPLDLELVDVTVAVAEKAVKFCHLSTTY